MNSPFLLAVLLAAVAPAAAQADAAFSAALSKPLAGLATMAQLKTQSQVPPAPQAQGPVAPAAAWQKLLDLIATRGVKGVDPATKVETWTLEERGTLPDGTMETAEILAVGKSLAGGKVYVHAVLLRFSQIREVNEPKGPVVLNENWFLEVQGNGLLKKVTYLQFETFADGRTVESPVEYPDPNSADAKEMFDYLVRGWTE